MKHCIIPWNDGLMELTAWAQGWPQTARAACPGSQAKPLLFQTWSDYLGPGENTWSQIVVPDLDQLQKSWFWPKVRSGHSCQQLCPDLAFGQILDFCRWSRSGTTIWDQVFSPGPRSSLQVWNNYDFWSDPGLLSLIQIWNNYRGYPLSLIQIWNNYRGSSSSKSRETAIFGSKYVLGINYGSLWLGPVRQASAPDRCFRSGTTTGARCCSKVEKWQFLCPNMYWVSTMALQGPVVKWLTSRAGPGLLALGPHPASRKAVGPGSTEVLWFFIKEIGHVGSWQ